MNLTTAQTKFLKSVEDGSIWTKPARTGQRQTERRLIELGLLKDTKLTEAGRQVVAGFRQA